MEVSLQDAILLERVVDPNSHEFKELLSKLVRKVDEGVTRAEKLNKIGTDTKFVLPYRGDSDTELDVESRLPVRFSDRGVYRNGAASLAFSAADLLDLIAQSSGRRRMTASLVVSAEHSFLREATVSAGSASSVIYYCGRENLYSQCASLADKLETMIFDHTTVNMPVDELLNFAYHVGARVVDGVFPYHVAARRGWDTVAGLGKWSYTHSNHHIVIGPDDDPSRLLKYERGAYMKFLEPSTWSGRSKEYFYEIRKCQNGLATYRAVYVGDELPPGERFASFKFPVVTSEDMVLVTINRELAAGSFVSRSNNARELAELSKNYAIEVRKELFSSAVTYIMSLQKDQDIVGNAIRYIQQHNYVDLVEGVRVIRCPSLGYADALCVAIVCALVAFDFRWKLTAESVPIIRRSVAVTKMVEHTPFGALGRIAWLFGAYVQDTTESFTGRLHARAAEAFYGSEYIPGVCYDVYMDSSYQMDGQWMEPHLLQLKGADYDRETLLSARDPFIGFFGDNVDTSAPTAIPVQEKSLGEKMYSPPPYVPNTVTDPIAAMQEAMDIAFPGNSTAQLQNVAELRRVRDVNINTEFYGKVEINKDISAPEQLHRDMPLRTSALPSSRTPLLDAIMASAKRNFNPPDLQMQTAVFSYAKELAEEFISNCFVEGYNDTLRKAYEKDPITFNLTDYMAWLANKDTRYRTALEAECPQEMVELELDRFDTIIKKRIKPKLSTLAQHELGQPQVIVSLSKKDTAPFTSVHRRLFERLDASLRPQFKSAGRLSDDQISEWLTENQPHLIASVAAELDSGKYDKSQNLLARLIEAFVLEAMGLDPGVNEIHKDSYVGRVSSRALGLAFSSYYQMKSGAPDTMLGNIIYNMVSAGRSVGYKNIKFFIVKGDDNVLWFVSGTNMSLATSKMSSLFNLDVKLIEGSVIYFSSGYLLFFDDRGYFAPDPLKLLELQGEAGASPEVLSAQFESFKDRCRSYTRHHQLPRVLEMAVRARHSNPEVPVVSLIDAFLAVSVDYEAYKRLRSYVK